MRDPAALRGGDGRARRLPDPGRAPATRSRQVPELSRRARGVPVWAALRVAGPRPGWRTWSSGCAGTPRTFADGIAAIAGRRGAQRRGVHPGVRDLRRRRRAPAPSSSGCSPTATAWMRGSRWRDRAVLRISVSNWSTTDEDVARSVEALRRSGYRAPRGAGARRRWRTGARRAARGRAGRPRAATACRRRPRPGQEQVELVDQPGA